MSAEWSFCSKYLGQQLSPQTWWLLIESSPVWFSHPQSNSELSFPLWVKTHWHRQRRPRPLHSGPSAWAASASFSCRGAWRAPWTCNAGRRSPVIMTRSSFTRTKLSSKLVSCHCSCAKVYYQTPPIGRRGVSESFRFLLQIWNNQPTRGVSSH